MKKTELKNKIEDYLYKKLDDNFNYEVKTTTPIKLLSKKRLDSIAKYIYAKNKLNKQKNNWANFVYKEHLRCLNNFSEKNNDKESFRDFQTSFDHVINSLSDGFDSEKSLLPIGKDNSPINGSHRLGACLALNKEVSTIKLPIETFSYDYEHLRNKGIDENVLDYMTLEYGKLKKDFHTAIIFPIALEKITEIKNILSEYGDIFYEKKLPLSRNGIHNLVLQMYRDHEWNKKENTDFSSSLWHSYNRFVAEKEVTIFFIESTNVEKMITAKKKIREIFNLGNFPIHISDDSEESIRISEQVLNENSLHFLNNAVMKKNKNFQNFFSEFDNWIKTNNYNKDDFCIDGSSILSVYGLREAKDLDYLSSNKITCDEKEINIHNEHTSQYFSDINELIYNPKNYFYHNGYKFLTLNNIRKIKKKRNELKDKIDIKLIDSILKEKSIILKTADKLKYFSLVINGHIIHFFRKNTPKSLFPFFKKIYTILKKLI